ncbi:WXG100-like domain-containing protein [Jatrophihabitans sp. YIM 134969]
MPRIDVDPAAYAGAADIVGETVTNGLTKAAFALTDALAGCGEMAGTDEGGEKWAKAYDEAAADVVGMAEDVTNGCYQLAGLLAMTGFNHDQANAKSTVGGGGRPAPSGYSGSSIGLSSPPSAAGGGADEPEGWHLIAHLVGYLWPDGHQDTLRSAGSAWKTAASGFRDAGAPLSDAQSQISLVDSPEVADATRAVTEMDGHIGDLASACVTLGDACDQYAQHLDDAHHQVITMLEHLVIETAAIAAGGGLLTVVTAGISDAAAAGAIAARCAEVAAEVGGVLGELIEAAGVVAQTVVNALARVIEVCQNLKVLLGTKLSEATAAAVSKIPGIGKAAEDVGSAALEGDAATAGFDFSTDPDTAFFWSGRTEGIGGADVAGQYASEGGGTTLEQLMEKRGIELPAWDADDPQVVAAWTKASEEYAAGVSGDVRAVIGQEIRPGAVWKDELEVLKHNPNVRTITTIDPKTGVATRIWPE